MVVRSEGGEEVMAEEEYQALSELKQVRKKEPSFWTNTSDWSSEIIPTPHSFTHSLVDTHTHTHTHTHTQLKSQYREKHASLLAVQVEVQHCKQYVDQCRARLLAEFEVWYKMAFLGEGGEEEGAREGEQVRECGRMERERK